jgi:hypothetical protein
VSLNWRSPVLRDCGKERQEKARAPHDLEKSSRRKRDQVRVQKYVGTHSWSGRIDVHRV